MQPYKANIFNALIVILISLWGFLSVDPNVIDEVTGEAKGYPFTALIPTVFGIVFLICTPMLKKENKMVAHIVVLLTFLLIVSLIAQPLRSQIAEGDNLGILRVCTMIFSGIVAMAVFIKSFRDARKART